MNFALAGERGTKREDQDIFVRSSQFDLATLLIQVYMENDNR
jgi:hypothetical protein